MAKVITKYRSYSTSGIKAKADIPAQSDMVETGSTILCSNISVTAVKNALGHSSNQVSTLVAYGYTLNQWSGFGPTWRVYSGSSYTATLVNSAPTSGFTLGSFAGYNKDAVTPGWQTGGKADAETDVWVNSGSKATVVSKVQIGEVQYPASQGLVLVAFETGTTTISAWSQIDINGIGDTANLTADSIDNITLAKTWTLRSYITDSNTIAQTEDIEGSILCRVPNVDDATVNIKVKDLSEWHYDGDGTTIPSPWVQNGSAGMNYTTGYFDIGSIARNNNYTNLKIYARLFDWTWSYINEGVIYNTSYTALDDVTGSAYVGMSSIPAYGYHIVVYFEYTT